MKSSMILNIILLVVSLLCTIFFLTRLLNNLGFTSSPKFNIMFWEWNKKDTTLKEQNDALNIVLTGIYLNGDSAISLMLNLDEEKVDKISDLTLVYEMPTNVHMGNDEPSGGLRMTFFNHKGFIYTNNAHFLSLCTDKHIEVRMNENLNSVMQGPFIDYEKFKSLYLSRIRNEGVLVATWRDANNNRQIKKWDYSLYLNFVESYKKNGGFQYKVNSYNSEVLLPSIQTN